MGKGKGRGRGVKGGKWRSQGRRKAERGGGGRWLTLCLMDLRAVLVQHDYRVLSTLYSSIVGTVVCNVIFDTFTAVRNAYLH